MNTKHLEQRFLTTAAKVGVSPEHSLSVLALISCLRSDDERVRAHYDHSLRVGHLAQSIASFVYQEPRPLLLAGTLHDIGKCQIPLDVLGKTSNWTEADALVMQEHVMAGYHLVKGTFDLSAEVLLWHHKFQKNGYPDVLPEHLHDYSHGTKVLIVEYGRILALADVYDALHRPNDKFGSGMSGERIRTLMFELNPDRTHLVGHLYLAGIFSI